MSCGVSEKSGFAIGHALRIDVAPFGAGDAERFEQLLLREIERVLPGLPGDQRRQQIGVAAVVVEFGAGRVGHRLVQHEFGAVGARTSA